MRPRILSALLAVTLALLVGLASASGAAAGGTAARAAADSPGAWSWLPPTGFPIEVLRPFVAPAHEYGPGHRGIDLRALPREPVLAPVGGTVHFSGQVAGRAVVTIRIDDRTLLSMHPVAGAHPEGARVEAGELLGEVSRGGDCDGRCVHLGVRVDGSYVDPFPFYAGRARLLPW
ncbi:peptidoglycan DD-metalloendopeptidase family protein [Leucobacter luti]|uniref:peptidoglycan DD-metalloendopeptidase family protein n=1 Tax=Leucobacter luti TaxID=340320 RepID=UPI003CFF3013